MLICFFIFILSFGAFTFGELDGENRETCVDLLPYEKMNEANGVPDEEQLDDICVGVLSYIECEEKNILDNSNKIDAEGDIDEDFRQIQQFLLNLCSKGSNLQNDYLESVTCFKSMENEWDECFETAESIYLNYRMFVSGVEDEEDLNTISYDEPYCMMNSYATACLGIKILETCGEQSHATFEELLSRSGYLKQYCSKAESDTLKTQFLDFLDLEQSQLEIFRNIFDFKKK